MKIDVLVRAIIYSGGKFLVCKRVDKNYYFFPGGHVNFKESTEKALKRELKEELGLSSNKFQFIGGSEHQFFEDKKKRHEINLVFKVLTNKVNTKSKENHLRFFLMDKNRLLKERVFPKTLTKAVLKWLKNKKLFWVSEI